MYGASIETPRNRLVGARTVKSSRCRGDMTAFQLEASAHAPWTRTIVGLGMCLPYRASDHEDGEDRVVDTIGSDQQRPARPMQPIAMNSHRRQLRSATSRRLTAITP